MRAARAAAGPAAPLSLMEDLAARGATGAGAAAAGGAGAHVALDRGEERAVDLAIRPEVLEEEAEPVRALHLREVEARVVLHLGEVLRAPPPREAPAGLHRVEVEEREAGRLAVLHEEVRELQVA